MKTAIIGGDKRMLYTAKAFSEVGVETAITGFDSLQNQCDMHITTIEEAVQWADFCVLPVVPEKNGVLNNPYSKSGISLQELGQLCRKKPVFSGFTDRIAAHFDCSVYDYAAREDFAVRNAALTAEGTVGLIIQRFEDSISGADILILGYGRIGKLLAQYLKPFGAQVTVAARKPADREWAKAAGLSVVDISLKELNSYQMILNTIPAPILDREKLSMIDHDALLIDLASGSGGVDHAYANELGLTCIHALGLPGKTAPKAAGTIIRDTIIQIIKEENGGKDYFGLCDDRLLLHL